jgi:lipoprotein-anchoring transpeptidase ErfK/SrfK
MKGAARVLWVCIPIVAISAGGVPQRIGQAVSHGCIRLRNQDVEEVYREAYIGEPVEITDAVEADHVQ